MFIVKMESIINQLTPNQQCITALEQSITHLRKQVIQYTQTQQTNQEQIQQLTHHFISNINAITTYGQIINNQLHSLIKTEQQQLSLPKNNNGLYQQQKVNLYCWQILNFISIHTTIFPKQCIEAVETLLRNGIECECVHSVNSMKNAHIFIHNFIVNSVKNGEYEQFQENIMKWMGQLLLYHYERQNNPLSSLSSIFEVKKTEQLILAQMQWLGYIFKQLFSLQLYSQTQQSLLHKLTKANPHIRSSYFVLHMIGNYLQQMVDKRVTTELVQGYECTLTDIRQMYKQKGTCLVELKLTKYDLIFICQLCKQQMHFYLTVVRQYIAVRVGQGSIQTLVVVLQKWGRNNELVMQICHIFNCVLFIGGYNPKLQDIVIEQLLQNNNTQLLQFMQLSYLLYRNIQSTRYQTKVNLVVEMEKEAKRKLFVITEVQCSDIETVQIKSLQLQKMLGQGQLVSILRLLTNLVHINRKAQKPFEDNVKYMHMILSLTHDSVSQMTMKEWAIMFIRNVSEWSQKLRQQIGNIKIQMKVQ